MAYVLERQDPITGTGPALYASSEISTCSLLLRWQADSFALYPNTGVVGYLLL